MFLRAEDFLSTATPSSQSKQIQSGQTRIPRMNLDKPSRPYQPRRALM